MIASKEPMPFEGFGRVKNGLYFALFLSFFFQRAVMLCKSVIFVASVFVIKIILDE